jgi:hypothetical protein
MRLSVIFRLAVLAFLILVVALVAVVKSIDVAAYRDLLDQAAQAATGRSLKINGRLSLRVSLYPALVAENVSFANVGGGSQPPMLTVKRLEAQIGFLPLLGRQLRVRRLVLVEPDLLLERDKNGRGNWEFGAAGGALPDTTVGGIPTVIDIAELRIEKGHVSYQDDRDGHQEKLDLDRLTADEPGFGANIGVLGAGAWNGRHFDLSGRLGPVAALKAAVDANKAPYPVEAKVVTPGLVVTLAGTVTGGKGEPNLGLKVTAEAADIADAGRLIGLELPALGAARLAMTANGPLVDPALSDIDAALGRKDSLALAIKGTIKHPLDGQGTDLVITAEGENLAGLNKALALGLPTVGPFKGSAHLSDQARLWRLADLRATLGHSDVSGEASLKLGGARPMVAAHLSSAALHLGEIIGGHGAEKPAAETPDARVFSDAPLPLTTLRGTDLDLAWKIDRLSDDQLVAQQVELDARVADGRLTVTPSIANLGGGKVSAKLTLDASGKVAQAGLSLNAEQIGLGEVLKGLDLTPALHGARSDLRANLHGSGNSLRSIMARLEGDTALVADQGKVEGTNAEALVVDVLHQLAPWNDAKDTDMRCLVSHFVINDGLAKSEVLLFDTARMTVSGQGSVNLANESLDLSLAPKPKEPSLLSLAVPLDLGGTLAEPTVTTDKGAIVKGVAGTIGGVALGPLGILVPLLGPDSDGVNPCVAAIAEAQSRKPGQPVHPPAKGKKHKGAKAASPPPPPQGSALHRLFGN